jgi:hypothetical protein
VYIKDGKVLAGSVPSADGKSFKKMGKVTMAKHQATLAKKAKAAKQGTVSEDATTKKKIQGVMKRNPDGVSISTEGKKAKLKDGYMVAMTDNEVTGKDINKEIDGLRKFASSHKLAEYFFGYWKDAHTGKEFLDVSVNVKDKGKAVKMAKKYDQKAIYGVKENEVIDTKEFDAKSGGYKEDKVKKSLECYNRNAYNIAKADGVFYIPINRLQFPYQTDKATNFDKVYANVQKMKSGENLEPIVIGYDYDVHDGHHRVEASKIMQYTHIPCIVGGNNPLEVQRAKEHYAEVWKSFAVFGAGKPEALILKSMNATFNLENRAWAVTVDFASEDFRKLAELTKSANITLKEI